MKGISGQIKLNPDIKSLITELAKAIGLVLNLNYTDIEPHVRVAARTAPVHAPPD